MGYITKSVIDIDIPPFLPPFLFLSLLIFQSDNMCASIM